MPIYVPGVRDRHSRPKSNTKRSAIATLSLTAMVDMFTVLTIFLIQNYKVTGTVIDLEKGIQLPQAKQTKDLNPSVVVILSKQGLTLEKTKLAELADVQAQDSWIIDKLYTETISTFLRKESELQGGTREQVQKMVKELRDGEKTPEEIRKVTLQADKEIDMLSVKKVMYTLTEAGATEINFAVVKTETGIEEEMQDSGTF